MGPGLQGSGARVVGSRWLHKADRGAAAAQFDRGSDVVGAGDLGWDGVDWVGGATGAGGMGGDKMVD